MMKTVEAVFDGKVLHPEEPRRWATGSTGSSPPHVEIVPLSEQLYTRALQLCGERRDKDWGLTDCVSFIVMQHRGMNEALTADEHFQQAGYRALMREGSPS